ncbi:PTS galactitol transporter subunit IIA [Psychromonas sp.]|uniref:PTS galactitol transporter subunit IIA n=1 Tax=Psychromonas sp. TaxID=1884585 RepID=UPI003568C496
MADTHLFINTELDFESNTQVLTHLNDFLSRKGFVKPSYLQALFEREKSYPTGIDFGFGAIAIPHCDASHAIKPCLYVIKPKNKVTFNQADDDGTVDAEIIIALVVTNPKEQMKLLKALFTSLQDEQFFNALKNSKSNSEISDIFNQNILYN